MADELSRQAQGGPRRFKPLDPKLAQQEEHKGKESLRGIVFDVDGTLCLPQTPMFAAMRSAAKIPQGKDILHHIASLPSPERENAMQAIKDVESEYMLLQTPQPGLIELMSYLTSRGVRKGLLTRNFEDPVRHLIEKFLSSQEVGIFEPVVTRAFEPPKPRPEGMWWIAQQWGLHLEPPPDSPGLTATAASETPDMVAEVGQGSTKDAVEGIAQAVADDAEARGKTVDQRHLGRGLIMVGDSLDDMTAGHTAGAATVLLVNDVNKHLRDHEHTDLAIERLDELIEVLENGFVGHRHR